MCVTMNLKSAFFLNLLVLISAQVGKIERETINGTYETPLTLQVNKFTEYIIEYHNNTEVYPVKITVSSNDASTTFPLLVVAQQQKRISSWQLPYIVNPLKNPTEYAEVGHILCPSIISLARTEAIEKLSRRILPQDMCSNPVVTIKSSSPKNTSFTITAEKQRDFFIQNGREYNFTIGISRPIYFYYNFHDTYNMANASRAVLVQATSTSSTCMLISIQNSSCPVFDLEHTMKFDSYWQTMNTKAGMVVTKRKYPNGFYVAMVVKQDNTECHASGQNLFSVQSTKVVTLKVTNTITLNEHFTIAMSTFAIFAGIFLICTIAGLVYLIKSLKKDARETSTDDVDSAEGMINQHQSNRWRQLFTPSTRSKSSSHYVWHVGIVALFYVLPVLQLVFTYQGILHETGNEDLCYYNFLCSHPLGFITDFNHVFSNIGYVFLGLLFIIITYAKELMERSSQSDMYGLAKPYGMFYALGFALIMEGIMSACYHICPKSSNFQFDTSFMYVMTVLMIVNIYENRHSTGDKRGYAVFGILAATTTFSVIGLYMGTRLYFWIIFSIIQVFACLALTWMLDKSLFKMIFSKDGRMELTVVHICRIILWIVGNILNWILVAYGIYTRTGFGTYLLMVLIVNGLFYTIFYISMKICHKEKILVITWVFIVLATLVWAGALYFFISIVTSWEVSPAASRALNQECALVRYYDSHDIWHFLSSVALFFTFIVLLTLDEGLVNVPRADITDFHSH